jgi:Predicted membrane protein
MSRNTRNVIVIAVFVAAAALIAAFYPGGGRQAVPETAGGAAKETAKEAVVNQNGDMVIPIADITENPTFYAYNELDSKMEIIAVKASDGTIRTAFNTCQVCYSSGKGYYKLEDGLLTCQNCGNQFSMDDVEVVKGGCNPVPIDDGSKTTDEETITISKDFLNEAQVIFKNWKI